MTRIKDLYETRVAAGLIQEDAAQRAVLSEFDRIREDLERPAKRSLFRRASKEAPKGLYLWGGVGRGKSMLMDLFVECLDVPVRRVHFHAFMQEIHAGLHEARAQNVQDALAPVAAKVISEVRCLAFDEMQITDITDAMIVANQDIGGGFVQSNTNTDGIYDLSMGGGGWWVFVWPDYNFGATPNWSFKHFSKSQLRPRPIETQLLNS
mgnify:CR=1 FL=1